LGAPPMPRGLKAAASAKSEGDASVKRANWRP
jgi:hypothetical protein